MIQLKPFKHLKLLLLIAFTVALSHFDTLAYDFEVDGIYYEIKYGSNNEVSVTYNGRSYYSGDVVIPETVTDNGTSYSVTSIGSWAFSDCSGLTSITIPNSVTSIGSRAFWYCSGLTSVTIPNSVTSIGDAAFRYCYGLTSVNGKFASVDHRCLIVDGVLKAFAPAGLTDYSIPNSVTSIGNGAFCGCTGLTSVTIPKSVTSIGEEAFGGCSGLTSVTIPNSVTSIGDWAFSYCSGLTSVTIPNSVTSIGEEAFERCIGLTSFNGKFASEDHRCLIVDGDLKAFAPAGLTEYSIPNSVTSIGYMAFYYCSGLTSVTIGNSVTSIGEEAFCYCSGLTSVTIPNSVTSIGSRAFCFCSGLTSVTIPNSVTSIGSRAFCYCYYLKSITVDNPDPANITLSSDVFSDVPKYSCVLYVPKGSKELYRATSPWSDFANIEEFEVASVPGDFDGNGSISVGDLQVMLNAILTLTPDSRFDLTGDGNVNAADIAKMIDIIMGR